MEFELENPLTSFKEHQSDTIPALFADETDHMPSLAFEATDFRFSVRHEAISLILQAQFSCNLDPFVSYVALNYIDRFISKQKILQEKPWIVRLLVTSCLLLAAKMKNIDVSLSDLQKEEGFIFNMQSIHRMEVLILTTLNWRMRSITPFSFLNFFLSLIELEDSSSQALKDRASEIIFKSHYDTKVLEFKPSIIAASALLHASHELFPSQFPSLRASISSCEYLNKECLLKCYGVMHETFLETVSSSTKTPKCVLDYYCTSTECENTTSNSAVPEGDDIKRRRLNDFCNDHGNKSTKLRLAVSRYSYKV